MLAIASDQGRERAFVRVPGSLQIQRTLRQASSSALSRVFGPCSSKVFRE
jgi:hypothetical protein